MSALGVAVAAALVWAVFVARPGRSCWWFARWYARELIVVGLPWIVLPGAVWAMLPGSVRTVIGTPAAAALIAGVLVISFPPQGISMARWLGPAWVREAMRVTAGRRGDPARVRTHDHTVEVGGGAVRLTAPAMWSAVPDPSTLLTLRGPSAGDPAGITVELSTAPTEPAGGVIVHDAATEISGHPARRQTHRRSTADGTFLTRHTWIIATEATPLVLTVEHADLDHRAFAPYIADLLDSLRLE